MDKCKSSFVVASSKAAILELVSGAAQFAETVNVVALGEAVSAEGVANVYQLDDIGSSVVPYVGAVVRLIAEQTDVDSISYDGSAFVTTSAGYGGLAVRTERSSSTAVICIGSGLFAPASELACPVPQKLSSSDCSIRFVERREKAPQHTNLSSAKYVVCVGRGIGGEENLALAEQLASVIGAEMGCTRPVAEEEKLMPSSRYIGVSGATVKPQLYIGIGVSGQIQHTSGIGGSEYVIAINKDDKAAIFKECDLGIVGDAKDVLTRVTQLLRQSS